jgi:hypothetical protein
LNLSDAVVLWRQRLEALNDRGTAAGPRTELTRQELSAAEREVQVLGATVRSLQEQVVLTRADQDAVAARLAAIENDKKRLQDVKRIQRLGGEMELPLLAEGRCPTCSQNVDDRDVATSTVSSVDDNIGSLDAERTALLSLHASAAQRHDDIVRSMVGAETHLAEARDRVRLLRDELVGPSNAPSVADVQERLMLEGKIRAANRVESLVSAVDEDLDELAERLDNIRVRRASLASDDVDDKDVGALTRFKTSFQDQLVSYNLRSLSPREVTIDDKSLLPTHDGFELSFDVAMGMSASDAIRTKWAYYTALMESATASPNGHHIGLLMLDEPRQQETDRRSLAAFLRRLRSDSGLGQIIYATSEDPDLLTELLSGIPHTRLETDGPHLIDFR